MTSTVPRTQQDLIAFLERTRGGRSDEIKLIAALDPAAAYHLRIASGYVHAYEDLCTPDQVLSAAMRELITFCQLCAKNEERLADYHIQRLYRLGVTESVVMEAAAAMAPVVGWSMMFLAAKLILAKRSRQDGELLGPPSELVRFSELDLGHERAASAGPPHDTCLETPEWRYAAEIDPGLAERAAAFVDHCLAPRSNSDFQPLLGPGIRELIAIPALCARGEEWLAARHIRRAFDYGLSTRQVLEAIACVLPMTGAVTVEIGIRAIQTARSSG